jgi:arginyl-tRNA synthetase
MEPREEFVNAIAEALKMPAAEIDALVEVPKERSHGDFALPCFTFAKKLKKSPQQIAQDLAEKCAKKDGWQVQALGPYVNLTIPAKTLAGDVLQKVQQEGTSYGCLRGKKKKMLVESPGPNTNKPLHLGHLRNMLLGQSITNVLACLGNDVHIVNVLNDRGVHICKSMLAYQKFGQGKTPESEGRKSDHFVGDMYVLYNQKVKQHPEMEEEIQEMLKRWEEGDPETMALWKKMNAWAKEGFAQTYERLHFTIEKEYPESETYSLGREFVLAGLKEGIFRKEDDGSVVVDLDMQDVDKKVLLRANGTTVYITQDIAMAKLRYDEYGFDEMIYVVGNEQEYHFRVLFEVFRKFGWSFADECKHFSYGMIELPEGKMKSREGKIVDTDNLLDTMIGLATEEVEKRYKDLLDKEVAHRAKVIGLGALRFFFLKFDPLKNFVYNPEQALAFEGETGPYVQYTYARISSIQRKAGKVQESSYDVLDTDADRALLTVLREYPETVQRAGVEFKPSLVCHYLIRLCQEANSYYTSHPVLKSEPDIRNARLALLDAVRQVIHNGLSLLGIETLEQM